MKLKVAAFTVAGVALIAPLLRAQTVEKARHAEIVEPMQATLVPVTLAEMFADIASHNHVLAAGRGVVVYENPAAEVMIVRRNEDGTVSHACVETEPAARKFLQGTRQNAVSTNGESK